MTTATAVPSRCRHRFSIFDSAVYVNSCSQGALSDTVRAAYEAYLEDWSQRGAPWEYWVERAEAARSTFAALVSAEPDDVAVTTSLSAAVSAFASALLFKDQPRVVVTDLEFPTIGQIWHAQELRGAEVVHVPTTGSDLDIGPIRRHHRTDSACINHCRLLPKRRATSRPEGR
jgi:selenocysteine lyase/cysteine desulfurase